MIINEFKGEIVETINLDIFIIPNRIGTFRSLSFYDSDSKVYINQLGDLNMIPENEDKMIQIWLTDTLPKDDPRHCDNWINDSPRIGKCIQETKPPKNLSYYWEEDGDIIINFPSILPASLFEGKMEKESISLTTVNGIKYVLRLNQKSYRYRTQGLFEEVLAKLI